MCFAVADANKENVDEKGKAPLLTANEEDTGEGDDAEDDDDEDDANEGDAGDMQVRNSYRLLLCASHIPKQLLLSRTLRLPTVHLVSGQQSLIDLKIFFACSWRGRCLKLPAPSTARWEPRRRWPLQVIPYRLHVHGIQWLSQGHPNWKALGALLSCRSDGMILLLQMCMSCWAILAWRKNALSRQLPTMRKLSSSLRTSLRYTLHAVALSHTPHLSLCEIFR